ncbi:VOC family protein [Nesterenkonia rhizosphaerae]|uniref:VOC family protein n=1 Tax=Nesterenkonia rhizosphaerae TaxID=1348272 RepID=A0ABP9G4U2_9MICC
MIRRSVTIALPIEDRKRSYDFYQVTLGLKPLGEPAADGVPEPLQFSLDERTSLMLIPAGGFSWVLGKGDVAPAGLSEVLLSLQVTSAEEVSGTLERMRANGGKILAETEQQEWGFTGVATDPDGHAWQIIADPLDA